MNARRPTPPWSRLVAAARRAPAPTAFPLSEDEQAPPGFSTRVVARALSPAPAGGLFAGVVFERFVARALGWSCAGACAVALWAALPATAEATAEPVAAADLYLDPVGVVLEIVQS